MWRYLASAWLGDATENEGEWQIALKFSARCAVLLLLSVSLPSSKYKNDCFAVMLRRCAALPAHEKK